MSDGLPFIRKMMEILKNTELMDSMHSMRNEYLRRAKDEYIKKSYASIEKVDTWKYSTGPIFDVPPFISEMAGFDGGHLLKKIYPTPYEARLKSAYSSGFINNSHAITISPSSSTNSPLATAFFHHGNEETNVDNINFHTYKCHVSKKPDALISIRKIFKLQDTIEASITVGSGSSFSIVLYYKDSSGKITSASMVTSPFDFQSNYEMSYDSQGLLISVSSGGPVWERKSK